MSFGQYGLDQTALAYLRDQIVSVGMANRSLIVAAVGNDGTQIAGLELPQWYWPAAYKAPRRSASVPDPVIRVAALSTYSYGDVPVLYPRSRRGKGYVDIAAPGTGIPSYGPGGKYYEASGTSQAAAIISGVLALMKSCAPTATASELKQLLLSSSDKFPSLEQDVTEGRVLNAGKAIDAACAMQPDVSLYMK